MEKLIDTQNQQKQISALKCTEVAQGFADWVLILLNFEKNFYLYPERISYHLSPSEKETLTLAQEVSGLLEQDDVQSALDIFQEKTAYNTSRVWH